MANHDEASSPPQHAVPEISTQDDLEKDNSDLEANPTSMGIDTIAKKKKKRKPKSKRGIANPTGFEEYYVDPPVTPEEYNIEQDLYSSSRLFSHRIETAIQRYKAKRNFDSERKDLFDKYMVFGGVDAGPKMFTGGLDSLTLEESSSAEITALTATNFVDDHMEESNGFVVDFDGCAKGFLASRLHQVFDLSTQKQIASHVSVIRNFLNYLLHHDVCPEYNNQINAARKTCDLAEKELWLVTQLSKVLPGDFNVACSSLFGGYYENVHVEESDWSRSLGLSPDVGMSTEKARRVFKFGLAARAGGNLVEQYNSQVTTRTLKITETFETGLEILELLPPEKDVQELYAKFKAFRPLGRVRTRTWYPPCLPQEDLTVEEEASIPSKEYKEYTLWVEDNILDKAFKGMKFETTIRKLSFGVLYFDSITSLYCSFFDILPNELMLGWREHVYLEPREKEGLNQTQNALLGGGDDDEEGRLADDAEGGDDE